LLSNATCTAGYSQVNELIAKLESLNPTPSPTAAMDALAGMDATFHNVILKPKHQRMVSQYSRGPHTM
jgi:hypothetical protein